MLSDSPTDGLPPGWKVSLLRLRLAKPFRIAHGSSSERVVLRIRWKNALGEAPFVPYYPDTPESVRDWLRRTDPALLQCAQLPQEAPAVVQLAANVLRHDREGQHLQLPVWKLLNLPNPEGASACRSLGIPTDLLEFAEDVRRAATQFRILKLKLGSGSSAFDEEIVATAREAAPGVILFGDVNGGWSVSEAVKLLPRVKKLGLSFVEQPVHHAEGVSAWKSLHSHLSSPQLPLYADESVQNLSDLQKLSGLIQGVNVKLLKTGGFEGALALIAGARVAGLKVILGCMVESSIGVTAAAHLAGACDWVDLDGHLYLREDDFEGLTFTNEGQVKLSAGFGLGVHSRRRPGSTEEPI